MRAVIWRVVVARTEQGALLPWWALLLRAILYPLDFFYWRMSKTRGYQPERDVWLINNRAFSARFFDLLTEDCIIRVSRNSDIVIFERVDK